MTMWGRGATHQLCITHGRTSGHAGSANPQTQVLQSLLSREYAEKRALLEGSCEGVQIHPLAADQLDNLLVALHSLLVESQQGGMRRGRDNHSPIAFRRTATLTSSVRELSRT
jgi:hypothetical protein